MFDWKILRIRDVAELFDGPHATPTKTASGPWFLSISSLVDGRLDLGESAHLSEADFSRWTRRVTPQMGDVLFSYETRLGAAALMPSGVRACLGRRMALLRPRPGVDPGFLLYAFLGPEFQETIRRNAVHGATVDRIPLNEFPEWPIRLPDLRTQRAIGRALGVLDEKIALNHRVAETALKLADAKYLAAVEGGLVEGRTSLGGAARWLSGGTPKTSEPSYWGGNIPWISAASLRSPWIGYSDRCLTPLGAERGTRMVPSRSIVFVVRGMSLKTEFRIGITQRDVAFGQDCKALVANDGIDPHWLFYAIRSKTREILKMVDEAGHGTGRLATDRLTSLEIPLPRQDAVGPLSSLRSLSERAAACERENRALVEMRDTLLPELIAGRIRVKEFADIGESNDPRATVGSL